MRDFCCNDDVDFICAMNVFDFDGTIYDGDSSIDFWLFSLQRRPSLMRYFPGQISGAFLYKIGKITKEEFKSRFFSFIAGISDADLLVRIFWDKNERKVKGWYKKIRRNDDCIISASPHFLLSEICDRLAIRNLIATHVDMRTGRLLGKNCHGKQKREAFRERFGNTEIGEFYSDSLSDKPMADLAKKAFFVTKEKIQEMV